MSIRPVRRLRPHFSPLFLLLAACGGGGGGGSSNGPVIANVPSREFKQQSDGSFLGKVPENQVNVDNLLGPEVSKLWSSYDVSITDVTVIGDDTATVQVTGPRGTATMTFTFGGVDAHLFKLVQNGSRDAVIQFKQRPDYERPLDSDGNNIFEGTLQLSAPGYTTERSSIKIVVTNLADGPTSVPSPSNRPSVPAHVRENDGIKIQIPEGTTEVFMFNSDRMSSFLGTLFDGPDADKFMVKRVLVEGERRTVITFREAPKFDTPTDQGNDSTYNFHLAEAAATVLGDLSFEVTVLDVV